MTEISGASIHISGIVQGVGFRPFVYGLAARYSLTGWVRNTAAGVDIVVDGEGEALRSFISALQQEPPPLAQIDAFQVVSGPPNGFDTFEIISSEEIPGSFIPVSPDVSICEDCLRELFDPADRRYLYPFINCTHCGPRFTIIQDIPYDRPNTTMAPFTMCEACREEYEDPLDRRFHAQPVACPRCGPQVWLEIGDQIYPSPGADLSAPSIAAIRRARQLLVGGKIMAIKGLGGFHLACDATNPEAVAGLRRRKLRVDKAFALMMPDLDTVARHCLLGASERQALLSRERPIVILPRRTGSTVASGVAPGQYTLGVMLPYTPLHYLLFADLPSGQPGEEASDAYPSALVMTSGNLSEEPIATGNQEARRRLGPLADAFLMHNREIHTRCDDSVVRVIGSGGRNGGAQTHKPIPGLYPLRRSRGFAPNPIRLPWDCPPLLAAGAELKNTFCLTQGPYAFLSHHIGDLENYETLCAFEEGIRHYEQLFRVDPVAVAYDLHPDYLSTRYALERAERVGFPAIGVQHHHAHVAACLAEHAHPGDRPVIGVSFDGTGYGEDGAIWGGEFLVADYTGFQRAAHLVYVPLPGGDKAVREPWRMALAWLDHTGIEWAEGFPPVRFALERSRAGTSQARLNSGSPAGEFSALSVLRHQLETGLNAPPTSSMGRLFDAVAALSGIRQVVNYEAQAAIEFEAAVDAGEKHAYPFDWTGSLSAPAAGSVIDPAPLFRALVADLERGVPLSVIAARFHNGVAHLVVAMCRRLRTQQGISEVALSGGVWQNMILLTRTLERLEQEGFTVYLHHQVPANDGGLALGQAAIAVHRLNLS